MKIIKGNPFKPYLIRVETREEHNFLLGLLKGDPEDRKENCEDYDNDLDQSFFEAVVAAV